ncbi:DEAD/DEAH box helicase family protein [Paraclostridium tenue]|uniref:DEAD/DEAH box helicase n=1 Tax=Paraclostridium tenue TaxID=1737 RepID=A0ABP3XD26_9FIRM
MVGKKLNLRYINEVISLKDEQKWDESDVVLIESQTGTGKTYYILGDRETDGFIDRINDSKLLYICNRIELANEIKISLLKKYDMYKDYFKIDKNSKVELDKDKVEKLKNIKNVHVTTYQSLGRKYKESIIKGTDFYLDEFKYIVCDESHYFLTDASFNGETEYAYELLVNGWSSFVSTRIFITATMNEMRKIFKDGSIRDIYTYSSGIDYSYLNIKYFKKDDTIVTSIKNDLSNDKWLIFVKSKNDGKKIKSKLEIQGISCSYIDAKNKDEEIENILVNNTFSTKVLITTKVLDNGVNINDEQIKHLVLSSYDQTTLIQEIGRLRVNINNARTINLYLNTFTRNSFNRLINTVYNEKFKQVNLFKNNIDEFKVKYSDCGHLVKPDLFRVLDNGYELNKFGYIRLQKDYAFAKYMYDKFTNEGDFAYIKEQLQWLGVEETFSENNYLDDKIVNKSKKSELINYLDSLVDKKILEDEQQLISDMIKANFNEISNKIKKSTKKATVKTLNSILENDLKLKYLIKQITTSKRVDGKPKKYTYWTILKSQK